MQKNIFILVGLIVRYLGSKQFFFVRLLSDVFNNCAIYNNYKYGNVCWLENLIKSFLLYN